MSDEDEVCANCKVWRLPRAVGALNATGVEAFQKCEIPGPSDFLRGTPVYTQCPVCGALHLFNSEKSN